jgi:cation diffusion facilitator family transporter
MTILKCRILRSGGSELMLYLALAGDIIVAALKFSGASATGSSALFSEGIHSTVDIVTELILLYGVNVSRRPSNPDHQFGYGREVFFWNFIAALTILALGAGIALLDGVRQILKPLPVETPLISYAVLLIALMAEVPALIVAKRSVDAKRGDSGFAHYVFTSRDPTSLTVLFGGGSGILGLLIAAIGTFLSTQRASPTWDGAASVCIAAILTVTALFLAANSKALLIGVPASPSVVRSILKVVAAHPSVDTANGSITVHLGPDQILAALSVAFKAGLSTFEIEQAVAAIDLSVRAAHPQIVAFLLKPQSPEQFAALRSSRGW